MINANSKSSTSKIVAIIVFTLLLFILTACDDPQIAGGSVDNVTTTTFTATSFKEDAQRYVDGANSTVDMITLTTVDGCGAFNPCN